MNSVTLDEWGIYIGSLTPDRLRVEARAANTTSFIDQMRDEGYTPKDIVEIFRLFAYHMVENGISLPDRSTGVISYYHLIEGSGGSQED